MKIDLKLFVYLQQFDETVENIDRAFAYLIQSLYGDQYYLYEWLPEEGKISIELGEEVYELIQNMTVTEIFELRNAVIDGLEN